MKYNKPESGLLASVGGQRTARIKHLTFSIAIILAIVFCTAFVTISFFAPENQDGIIQNQAAVIETTRRGDETGTFRPGHLLVKFSPGISESSKKELISQIGGEEVDRIRGIEVALIKVPEQAQEALLKALNNNPKIEYAEPDALLAQQYTPNDPRYTDQWQHQNINSEAGWDLYQSVEPVTIAIADSGIYTEHEDLKGRVVGTYNAVDGTSDVTDVTGHGTKVAGVAAAIGDNALGVTGVSYRSNIFAIKVSNTSDGSAYLSDLAKAVTYAADNNIRVVNISYDACSYTTLKNAADYMETKKGMVVVAAGNSGDELLHAEALSEVCVSATDRANTLTSWSSFGAFVDFTMPGSNHYSTNNTGGYSLVSGTSFSSPMMAGVVALLMSVNPALGPNEIKEVLKQAAKDLGEPGWDKYYGWGIIDLGVAANLAKAGNVVVTSDTKPPTVSFISPKSGEVVSGVYEVELNVVDDSQRISYVIGKFPGAANANMVDFTSPYIMYFDTTGLANGPYTLEAVAYDTAYNQSSRLQIQVEVLNVQDTEAPVVTIVSPVEGEMLPSRGSFTVTSKASDNVGVSQITIAFDGVVYGTCSGATSCETLISLRRVKVGPHSVSVTALDQAGNTTTKTVNVTVGETTTTDGSTGTGGKPTGGRKN